MSDLKSFWPNPGAPSSPDPSGSTIVSRGSDPAVTVDSPNALQPVWSNPPVGNFSGEESENSVSGLPANPNRYEPAETPPPPPTLQDRRPGTIDER